MKGKDISFLKIVRGQKFQSGVGCLDTASKLRFMSQIEKGNAFIIALI